MKPERERERSKWLSCERDEESERESVKAGR